MSFGIGPFGLGPYGTPTTAEPAADPADLSSSRNIDMKSRTYVQDARGGYSSMDDVHQRVGLLMAFEFQEPTLIEANFPAVIEAETRRVLAPFTAGSVPQIQILSIDVVVVGGQSYRQVRFKKLATDTEMVVRAPI